MLRHRTVVAWSLGIVCALAFSAGAASPRLTRALAQGFEPAVLAQDPPVQEPPDPAGRGAGRGGQAQAPRPYAQVITSAAKTDEGVFKVHRITTAASDTVYYEIPKAELGKDFLWKTQLQKTTIGAGFGGQEVGTPPVVRWVTKGDRVLLLNIDYSTYADPSSPVAIAVEDANYPSIIRAFNVAAYSPSGDPVIDVTPLFLTDVPEFSARGAVGGRGVASDRTVLERALSFPENINVEVTMTYTGGAAEGVLGGGRGGGGRAGMRGPSGTVVVSHSMVKLPAQPMMPRRADERVGYTTQSQVDYGTDEHRSVAKSFIKRFRLVKKDPNAAVSEPVKPIVFFIDAATPKVFVPYVRRGIEDWQPALEAAGFRNAIQAREAPVGDAEWSAEDARYSVIRWAPPGDGNPTSVAHDPRSGEILTVGIDVFPGIPTFSADWYFVQAAPLDKRAQQLPLPEALHGELIRYFVAHQIGHALGLQHNRKASSAYTIAQIRDPKWAKTMGFTPSIMDDARFNYVAQPEDGVDPADLIPRVGPYDRWAVRWGYAPVPGATSTDAERAMLDKWAREQDQKPELRFSTQGQANTDPGENATPPANQSEDLTDGAVGNVDPVAATTLGVKNLVLVSDMMLKATSTRPGEPWDDLRRVYGRMVNQWSLEMNQVVRVIGGVEAQQKHIGQDGPRFRTVPRARQAAALPYLVANALTTPSFMIKPEILRRIQPVGVVDRVRLAQRSLLDALLQNARLDRMTEQVTLDGAQAYPPLQFLADLRAGVWSEAAKPGTAITIYRRNLQRAYLDNLDDRLKGTPAASAEVRALLKGELQALDRQLQAAAGAPGLDENTRRHLVDSRELIAGTLDSRVPPRTPPAAGAPVFGGRGGAGLT